MAENFCIDNIKPYLSSQLTKFIYSNEFGEIRNLIKYIDIYPLLESLSYTRLFSFCNLIIPEHGSLHYRMDKNKLLNEIRNVILPKIKNEYYFEIVHDNFFHDGDGVQEAYPEYSMTIVCYPPISDDAPSDAPSDDASSDAPGDAPGDEYIFTIYIILSGHHYCCGSTNFDLEKIEIDEIDFKENITEDEKKKSILAFAKNGLKYINSKLSQTMLKRYADELHNECYLKLDENEEYVDESEEDDCSNGEENDDDDDEDEDDDDEDEDDEDEDDDDEDN